MDREKITASLQRLKEYCEKEDFKGWDPYDGLNSKWFKNSPLNNFEFLRLTWIQLFRRLPINCRRLAMIDKGHNPQGIALFILGYCHIYRSSPSEPTKQKIDYLVNILLNSQTTGWSGACWGYNFAWQAKAFYQPAYSPTVVATSFVVNALLEVYELFGDEKLLKLCRSSCDFVLKDLNRVVENQEHLCFSYSPLDEIVVFNASLLGGRLLANVFYHTGEKELMNIAEKSIAHACAHQRKDGSWFYGLEKHHQWIDGFHTGYNLECLSDFMGYTGIDRYSNNLVKGANYYLGNFFTKNGIAKYYNNKTYPVDMNNVAQGIVFLAKHGELKQHQVLVDEILKWTIATMQSKNGYFYYRKFKYFTIRIPYMRWSQAWGFYALSIYLKEIEK